MGRYKSDREFEEEVRRVAAAVFELQAGDCQSEIYSEGKRGAEIDGVARTRYVVHLIMATTSSKLDKVKEDVEKLLFASKQEEKTGIAVTRWMIVEKMPEGPHVTHARKHGVQLLTLRQFRERFFNGEAYLSKRRNAPFGSARDLETGSVLLPDDEFIEPPMAEVETGRETTLQSLIGRLRRSGPEVRRGDAVVLLGPFGSGKSLSLRETWLRMRECYRDGSLDQVPIALNLREHWGAQYGDEILLRHARTIGFIRESDLTVAWRAGMLILLIDGFDEMASQGLTTVNSFRVLRQIRRNALEGVRHLVAESPPRAGVLITGRDHYFDDSQELIAALGLENRDLVQVRLEEFDDLRATSYLRRKGISLELPDWLPRRALLLGYLAKRRLLEEVLSIDGTAGQARAWTQLLALICRREAQADRSAMESDTVQRVLEHLAIQLRSTPSGIGPISASMLAQSYTAVTEQVPGDAVLMQLQRLPGLTERNTEPGTRSFLDQDLLETLQGVAVSRLLTEGVPAKSHAYRSHAFLDQRWLGPLGPLGCSVAVTSLRETGWTLGRLQSAIRDRAASQLGADLLQVALAWAVEEESDVDLNNVELVGVHVREIDLDEVVVRGLCLRDCIIERLTVGAFAIKSRVDIADCLVSEIAGAGSRESLPENIRLAGDVEVERFDPLRTTAAIVGLEVEEPVKALLTALKKLFRQRGAGRVVGAFHRGVPQHIEGYIEPVLRILVQEDLAWRLRDVYHPVRKNAGRAHRLLDNPRASTDPILQRVRAL